MSNSTHNESDASGYGHTSRKNNFVLNVIVVVAIFAIFAIILTIAYIPQRSSLTISSTSELTPEQRAATLTELRAKEKSAATTYGWIDQPKGIVRLPVDRAVELTIRDFGKEPSKERGSPDPR